MCVCVCLRLFVCSTSAESAATRAQSTVVAGRPQKILETRIEASHCV